MSSGAYELVFYGSASVRRFPRFRRKHPSYESAVDEAKRIYGEMHGRDIPVNAHTAIVYGPDLHHEGRSI